MLCAVLVGNNPEYGAAFGSSTRGFAFSCALQPCANVLPSPQKMVSPHGDVLMRCMQNRHSQSLSLLLLLVLPLVAAAAAAAAAWEGRQLQFDALLRRLPLELSS